MFIDIYSNPVAKEHLVVLLRLLLLLHGLVVSLPYALLEPGLDLAKLQHQVVEDLLVVDVDQGASNVAVKVVLVGLREGEVELTTVKRFQLVRLHKMFDEVAELTVARSRCSRRSWTGSAQWSR